MKKILLLVIACFVSGISYSQSWELSLNGLSPNRQANIGTSTNHPINFYSNNTHWMTLTTGGALNLTNLAGTGSRFLQVDANGDIFPWTGNEFNVNELLHGDGTWRPAPILRDGDFLYTAEGANFGIGVSTPVTKLDVLGSARVSENFGAAKSISIGDATQFGMISYIPATSNHPAILSFGGGYNTEGLNFPPPPNPNEPLLSNYTSLVCSNGPAETSASNALPIANFHNDLIVDRISNNVGYGTVRLGHNGYQAFLEVQGTTNPGTQIPAPLLINSCDKRNIYAFGGEAFEASINSVMSVTGKLNVSDQQQIGAKSSNAFMDTKSKLFVAIENDDYFHGIKVRQDHDGSVSNGTDYHAIKVVDSKNDYNYAFGVYRTTDNSDGVERFNILADGSTYINTTNADALVISDANNGGQVIFKVNTDGKTEIKTSNSDAFTIKDGSNNINFKVKKTGYVYAREVVVTLNSFPDYVFSGGYKLPTLREVKSFIEKNHKLPNMPSAKEVEQNGANLGEIQKITIEKVEELYLYILQLEEKIEALNKKIAVNK